MTEKTFVVLVTGSRKYRVKYRDAKTFIFDTLDRYQIDQIIVGDAEGVDAIVTQYANIRKIPIKIFVPDWEKYGKPAGMVRNNEMVKFLHEFPNPLGIGFWNGKSHGTKQCIDVMRKNGIRVDVYGGF